MKTIQLQGKEFVTHEGLLDAFHQSEGGSIKTELVEFKQDLGMFIFRATVIGKRGEYSAYGDASPKNVNSMIAPHLMRMAETRAINRALRLYTNIGMCSVDELGGEEETKPKAKSKPALDTIKVCTDYEFDAMMSTGQFSLDSGVSKKTGKPFYLATYHDQKYWLTEPQHKQLSQ